MTLPVYVINLADGQARWDAITRSAEIHARSFALHRVEAVDGRTAGEARLGADLAAFLALQGRDMLPGEYGCYRSHLKALEAFMDSDVPHGLILEDDILFMPGSAARIEAVLAAFGPVKPPEESALQSPASTPTSMRGALARLATEEGDDARALDGLRRAAEQD